MEDSRSETEKRDDWIRFIWNCNRDPKYRFEVLRNRTPKERAAILGKKGVRTVEDLFKSLEEPWE